MQLTNNIFMIKPMHFAFNHETSENNFYQKNITISDKKLNRDVLIEFDGMVNQLLEKGVNVKVFEDKESIVTPDSIFPNNWISTHKSGEIVLYPMYASNRRLEVRTDIIEKLIKDYNFSKVIDFRKENEGKKFLEGTGSMILDRQNKILYASVSERTNKELVNQFSKEFGYSSVLFNSYQKINNTLSPIYHTNVMMSLCSEFCVICLDSIDDLNQKKNVILSLEKSGKKIIDISQEQKNNFAGNMLQLQGKYKTLVMSSSAFNVLSTDQKKLLESMTDFAICNVETIEKIGGGSTRCMIAEIFSYVE